MSLFAKGLEYGRLAFTEVGHRARTVEEDLKARREDNEVNLIFLAPGDDAFRGKDGPLLIEDYRTVLPVTHAFVKAATEAGHPFLKDLSAHDEKPIRPAGPISGTRTKEFDAWAAEGSQRHNLVAGHAPA